MPAMKVDNIVDDDEISVLSYDDESIDDGKISKNSRSNPYTGFQKSRRGGKRRPSVVELNDDSTVDSTGSFDGHRSDGEESLGGMSRETLGEGADVFIAQVEKYLADYDPAIHGPIDQDPELVELQAALEEAKKRLEKSREAADQANVARKDDIEDTKTKVEKIRRRNTERRQSIDGNSITSKDAEDARNAYVSSDDEELDRSGHEMNELNAQFEKQKQKVLRQTKKAESLAIEMKLGAKRAMRRLRLIDVKARIAREEEEKARLAAEQKNVVESEEERRRKVHNYYMRYAMPKKSVLKKHLKKLPGIDPNDVDLLPWDEKGLRVNVSKYNKVVAGLSKPDW